MLYHDVGTSVLAICGPFCGIFLLSSSVLPVLSQSDLALYPPSNRHGHFRQNDTRQI
jgi:hypothetical protein